MFQCPLIGTSVRRHVMFHQIIIYQISDSPADIMWPFNPSRRLQVLPRLSLCFDRIVNPTFTPAVGGGGVGGPPPAR